MGGFVKHPINGRGEITGASIEVVMSHRREFERGKIEVVVSVEGGGVENPP